MDETLYQSIGPLSKVNLIWNTLVELCIATILVAVLEVHGDFIFKFIKSEIWNPGAVRKITYRYSYKHSLLFLKKYQIKDLC